MVEKMKRIALFVTNEQWDRLSALARGRPVSELIRQAIDEFLTRMESRMEK
jgi:predicted DNA-binding protein